MNVLLIEPDSKLAKTYTAALREAGHTVIHCLHAQDAVHASDRARPDVVVLELQLRKHGGMEFLYEFRSYGEWQDIPVILLTMVPDSAFAVSKAGLRQLGVVNYLYKPSTTLGQFVETVEAVA